MSDEVKQKVYIHIVGDPKPWCATVGVFELAGFLEGYRDPEVQSLHVSEHDPMRDWYLNKDNIANIVVMNLEDVDEGSGTRRPPAKSRRAST